MANKAKTQNKANTENSASLKNAQTPPCFYTTKKNEYGDVIEIKSIDYLIFIQMLYDFGFRRFDIEKSYTFVHITNQIVKEVTVTAIQDFFIEYIENLPDELEDGVTKEMLQKKFYKNPSHYFNDKRLSLLNPKEIIEFNTDTNDCSFTYYKNGYVVCTKEGYKLHDYKELKKCIWKEQIINRDFKYLNFPEYNDAGVFSKFIYNISGKNDQRFVSIVSIIGYLLHNFFQTKLKAILLTDSRISEEANGRTGKNLFTEALGKVRKWTDIPGKDFDPSNKHKYQEVNLDTQILSISDLKKYFDVENFFNDITEGVTVEYKNIRSFKKKVKILISTNKTLKIEGGSAKDRFLEFEFADYYSDTFSPKMEFNQWFFSEDWDEMEWARFDNFMMMCSKAYFEEGLITPDQINLNKRKLIDQTNTDFVEFMDNYKIKLNKEYNKTELHNEFLTNYPDYNDNKSRLKKQSTFTKYLKEYAKFSDGFSSEVVERQSGANKYIVFKSDK